MSYIYNKEVFNLLEHSLIANKRQEVGISCLYMLFGHLVLESLLCKLFDLLNMSLNTFQNIIICDEDYRFSAQEDSTDFAIFFHCVNDAVNKTAFFVNIR